MSSAAHDSKSGVPWWSTLLAIPLWPIVFGMTAWAFGALWYDFPFAALKQPLAAIYALAAVAVVVLVRGRWRKMGVLVAGFVVVLGWWRTLQPSNDRAWQPDVANTPWAEIDGDKVTLHNVRNCDYRTEFDYTPRWETRTVDLSRLKHLDLAINYWGSAWMAHPIASFQFDDAPPVCFSIETRKEIGETYSAIGGLYRQFELIYVCADERDVLRVRTNYRIGEEVFLYRLTAPPVAVRERFMEYVEAMNTLRDKARWYNAATTNCTTNIRTQRAAAERAPWDWRMLFNGYGDQMLYEKHAFAGDLPFAKLRKRALVNAAAKAADQDPDFSKRIRADRPGFTN